MVGIYRTCHVGCLAMAMESCLDVEYSYSSAFSHDGSTSYPCQVLYRLIFCCP